MSVTFHIPGGPMNLQTLFPAVDFDKVEEYYLELRSQYDDSTVVTTPAYKRSCCCSEDTIRLFFVNYLGGIDAVNFIKIGEEREVSSAQWKKSLQTPLQKWDGGLQRFNVESLRMVTAENICYSEKDQEWLMELVESPNAWIQWIGTQGQDNSYLPIVMVDGKFTPRKSEERYNYVLQVQFIYSNEQIILRN